MASASKDVIGFNTPMSIVHLEMWVSNREDRARMRMAAKKAYLPARRITRSSGGSGPWIYLADQDPPDAKTVRLRNSLGVKQDEDVWVEMVFYPNRRRMKSIITRIWKDRGFLAGARRIDRLVSRRIPGYEGIVGILSREGV